jgi:hypothetical protein
MDAHRKDLINDMHRLLEKFCTNFGWDIPEIDQPGADKLVLAAMHKALDNITVSLAICRKNSSAGIK